MTEKVIRLLIIDNDKRGSESLRLILQSNPEVELLGIFESGKEGLASCKSLVPDVIITGAKLADMPSSEFNKAIIHRYPSIGIVAASYGADVDWIGAMLRLGIRTLVNKPFIPEIVLDALRFAHANPPKLLPSRILEEKEASQNWISVLIVDEDTKANEQLKRLIEAKPEYKLLGIFESGKEALVTIARLNPDVIIVGSELGDICRDEFIKASIILYPPMGIITNSSQDPEIMQHIMLLGVRLMINRPCNPDELDNAIHYAKKFALNGLRAWELPDRLKPKGSRQKDTISVLLIDDETTDYRVRAILDENPKFKVLGSFQTGKEALATCAETLPEVIVLRVETSDMPEEDFVRAVFELEPSIGFLKLWYTKNSKSMKDMMKGIYTSWLKLNNAMNLYNYLQFAKENPPRPIPAEEEA